MKKKKVVKSEKAEPKKNKNGYRLRSVAESDNYISINSQKMVHDYIDECAARTKEDNLLKEFFFTITDEILVHLEAANVLTEISKRVNKDLPLPEMKEDFAKVNLLCLEPFLKQIIAHMEFFEKTLNKLQHKKNKK